MLSRSFERANPNFDQLIKEIPQEHKYFYKYLPIEYLLDSLENNHLVFANPLKWNDPFDNYLFRIANELYGSKTFTKQLFCHCMTLNPHSQAYWKTYSDFGFSARLSIDTKEYLTILKNRGYQVWIGEMDYLRERDCISRLKKIKNLKINLGSNKVEQSFLSGFILKRQPFEYEKEVRVLLKSNPTEDGLKRVQVDTKKAFKEIRLDPRMGTQEEKAWKNYLKNRFGIKVTKSLLFKEKNIL